MEAKLVSLGSVKGVVSGDWGEVSEHTHALLQAMTMSRVRVAGPSTGRRGLERTEEGERSIIIGYPLQNSWRCRCQGSGLLFIGKT